MPRLFIAIDPPDELRQEIKSICRGLQPGARWTPSEQLHLTLRFIGEVDDHLSLLIKRCLTDLPFMPFFLQISGIGHFPSGRQPKILWTGVAKNPDLMRLQSLIEGCLVQLGLASENRRFRPHLTIARLTPQISPEILASYLARNSRASFAPFRVDSFHLYSSLLTKDGALHRLEGSFTSGESPPACKIASKPTSPEYA